MIKKVVYLSILFIGLFTIGNNKVYAYQPGEISYDIEYMDVSNDTITFSGWAIAHSVNNIGGVTTKVSIIATDGTNEVVKSSTKYKTNNLYLGLCINVSGKCAPEYKSTCHSGKSSNTQFESSCIFRNVSFAVSFNIKELKEKFNTKEIKFKLRIEYNDSCHVNANLKTYSGIYVKGRVNAAAKNFGITCSNNNYKSNQISLGVHTNRITVNGAKKNVTNGNLSISKGYHFNISGISNSVDVVGSANKIQKPTGSKYGDGIYFNIGNNTINPNKKTIYNSMYQVDMYALVGYGRNGDTYALSSWLKTNGEIILKFDEKEEDPTPPASSCPNKTDNRNSSCVWDNSTDKGRQNTTTVNYNGTTCREYESVVYYQSKYSDDICSNEYTKINGRYYLQSTISSGVNFTQKGTLTYILGPNTIHSGGATAFSVTYANELQWGYKDRYKYTYGYRRWNLPIKYNDFTDYYEGCCGSKRCTPCCISETVTDDEIVNRIYRNGESFLNKDKNSVSNGEEIIETFAANDYDSNYLNTLNSSYSIGVPANDIQGYWTGTNASAGTRWNGSTLQSNYYFNLFDAYINRTDGTVTYSKSDTNIYGSDANSEYLYKPKNYFIPLDFHTGKYNFKFSISDLSTMRGGSSDLFKWSSNYTCDVNCEQKFYGKKDGYYFKYRPIDLNNVFPRNNAGFQWRQWMESDPIGVTKVKSNGTLVLDDEKKLQLEVGLDANEMTEIRKHNDNNEHLGGYLNESIDLNGKSNFLKDFTYTVNGGNYKLGCGSLNQGRGECQ